MGYKPTENVGDRGGASDEGRIDDGRDVRGGGTFFKIQSKNTTIDDLGKKTRTREN
jgi:hypothetical protein